MLLVDLTIKLTKPHSPPKQKPIRPTAIQTQEQLTNYNRSILLKMRKLPTTQEICSAQNHDTHNLPRLVHTNDQIAPFDSQRPAAPLDTPPPLTENDDTCKDLYHIDHKGEIHIEGRPASEQTNHTDIRNITSTIVSDFIKTPRKQPQKPSH